VEGGKIQRWKRWFLFPGQGFQFAGMGKALAESTRAAEGVRRGGLALEFAFIELCLRATRSCGFTQKTRNRRC